MKHELTQLPNIVIGEITGVDDAGLPVVRWHHGEPTTALVVWMATMPDWPRCTGARVVLGFLGGEERRPIVLGLLDAPRLPGRQPETLRIECGRELAIECGQAKILLRADGRIEIRGSHLVSRSTGCNKIKGGSVFIN